MTEPREPWDNNDLLDETDDDTVIRRPNGDLSGGGVLDIDPEEVEIDRDPDDSMYGVSLEELAARPDSKWSELATELLAIRAEREQKVEQEAIAASSLAAAEAGIGDFTDRAFLDGLRAQVEVDRQAADKRALAAYERDLTKQGFGEETVAGRVADMKASLEAVAAFEAGSDALWDSPAYAEHEAYQFAASRGRQGVEDYIGRDRTILDDAADAEREIADIVAAQVR